jgi:predicted metalloendopeptidase
MNYIALYIALLKKYNFKIQVSLMIKYLRDSFKVLVQESDWLDDITKNKSLEKLDAIIENNVYPDWILDNQELDKYYNLVN